MDIILMLCQVGFPVKQIDIAACKKQKELKQFLQKRIVEQESEN
jgi:hypothetical protein